MTQNQIVAMACCGVATAVAGAAVTGFSIYKLINLSEKAEFEKLSYDEADQIYYAGMGVMIGTGMTYLGASFLGTSINNAQYNAYFTGVDDAMKVVAKRSMLATQNYKPCTCQCQFQPTEPAPAPAPNVEPPVTVTTF